MLQDDMHPMHSQCITQDITLDCVDGDGQSMVLPTAFGYDSSDPYAVTTTFRTQWCEIVWTFARDLLSRGLTEPVGDGDVHVWPCLDPEGRAVVVIEFVSPDGELLVQAPAADVALFVTRTHKVVPLGSESAQFNVDELIGQLLAV